MAQGISLKGTMHYEATRSSKQYGEGRLCAEESCETTLSRYNRDDKCFLHAPKRAGRVRGWKQPK